MIGSTGNNSNSDNNDSNTTSNKPQIVHQQPSKRSRIPSFNDPFSEDEKVIKKFIDVIQHKIDHGLFQPPTQREREIIKNAVFFPGFFIGCFVGIGSFVAMRRLPLYIMDRLELHRWETLRQIRKSRSGNVNSNTNNLKQINNVVEDEAKPKPYVESSPVMVIGSIIDITLASMFGFMAWSFNVNKKKAFDSLAEVPLLPGKSEISNALCTDFIDIYKQIRPRFWKEYKDDSVAAIAKFVRNCEKRHLYQKQIGREMGLASGTGLMDIELPSAVPDEFIQDVDELDDWAALEDFDEDEQNER